MKVKIRFSIVVLIVSTIFNSSAISGGQELNILYEFPNEKQMIDYDYVLGRGTRFDADDKAIYFCSQRQHVIFKIDYKGNLIQRIGRNGQGPGEFNLPLIPYLFGDRLLVSDNGNSRIQFLTLDGIYIKQIKMIEGISSLVSIDDRLYMLLLREYGNALDSPIIIGQYDIDGHLVKYFGEPFQNNKNFYYDNAQTIRSYQGQIHCLQLYGATYRIYDRVGNRIRQFQLKINPLDNPEYRKTGWLYAYRSFALGENKIYATHSGKGEIRINVFDCEGNLIYSQSIKQDTDEICEVSDMKIIYQNSRTLLLLLVHYPDTKFVLAELGK